MNEWNHFYTPSGELVEGADSRQARADRLYPSVTTLIKRELPTSYGLTQWRERKIATQGWLMGDLPTFDEDDADDAREKAMEETVQAAERGKALHDVIRRYLSGDLSAKDELPEQLVSLLHDRSMSAHLDGGLPQPNLESVQVNERWGFAGTVDYHGPVLDGYGVVDFKTQRVQKAPQYYPDWLQQLAGYQLALSVPRLVALYNVVIDAESGRCWMRHYAKPEMVKRAQRQLVLAAVQYWVRSPEEHWPRGVRDVVVELGQSM